jgi:hypothetical protein
MAYNIGFFKTTDNGFTGKIETLACRKTGNPPLDPAAMAPGLRGWHTSAANLHHNA